MTSYDFSHSLPKEYYSYDIGIPLDDGFISFMAEWLRKFPIPDMLVFDGLSDFKEKTEGEFKENNILYQLRKIKGVERYVVFLRSFDELLKALKTAIFEINNGFEGCIFFERTGAVPNFFSADIESFIPNYKYTIFLCDDGLSIISKDESLSAIEKVKASLPGNLKVNVYP